MSTKDTYSSSRPGFEWLYPDLLTKEQLLNTLEQRYIRGRDLQTLEKDALVELYNKYIIPLPQRKYRLNRRGRDMTVKQVKLARKRRAVPGPDYSQPPEKRRSTGKLLTSFDMPPTVGDRLKPPPSCIDTSKKKIKLGSSSTSPSSSECVSPVSTSLTKLKLTKSESSSSGTATEVPKKIIKLKGVKAGNGDCSNDKTATVITNGDEKGSKQLEEPSDAVKESNGQEPMDASDSGSENKTSAKKKIKLTKIGWP